LPVPTNFTGELIRFGYIILKDIFKEGYRYKRVGVLLTGLDSVNKLQYNLFDKLNREKAIKLMEVYDSIRKKYGKEILKFSAQGIGKEWKMKQEHLSDKFTTDWDNILTINIQSKQKHS
jgi:DNA polymerase V